MEFYFFYNFFYERHIMLYSEFFFMLQPKFGGKIIDIVSRGIQAPDQKAEALDAVKNTVLEIMVIVVIGYV